jgi:4a-hydroxytetrahydrobiopterin dehydratase
MTELANKRCAPCEGGVQPMDRSAAETQLRALSSRWSLADDGKSLGGDFEFKNYYRTTAFVNAVAWIAHREDHHPDVEFGYKNCRVHYTTHAIGGLSENDFICAAKIDRLLED